MKRVSSLTGDSVAGAGISAETAETAEHLVVVLVVGQSLGNLFRVLDVPDLNQINIEWSIFEHLVHALLDLQPNLC